MTLLWALGGLAFAIGIIQTIGGVVETSMEDFVFGLIALAVGYLIMRGADALT